MNKVEFNLLYARFHFNIDKDEGWEKIKLNKLLIEQIRELVEWESGKLYDELVKLGVNINKSG